MADSATSPKDDIKIIAPIGIEDKPDELAKAGASALYIWIPLVYDLSESHCVYAKLDRKYQSSHDIESLIGEVHSSGMSFYLWLDAPSYCDEVVSTLWGITMSTVGAGAEGIITNNVDLMFRLNDSKLGIEVIADSSTQVANIEAADFLAEIGISRIILPSHLSPLELSSVSSRRTTNLEYGYCIYGSEHVYEEGFSNVIDVANNYHKWELEGYNEFFSEDIENLNYQWTQAIRTNELCRKEWFNPPFLPNVLSPKRINCAVCMLPKLLQETNVTILQIGNGILNLPKRLDLIHWICTAAQAAIQGADAAYFKNSIEDQHPLGGACRLAHRCIWRVTS